MHEKPSEPTTPRSSPGDAPEIGARHGRQLLLVEDEAVIRFVLRHEIEQRGFAVTEVEDGRSAIEQFSQDPARWVGVFVDYLLPDAHGDELIDQFLLVRPDLSIVLMTGDCDVDTDRIAEERKLTVLRKPFPLERVRPLLAEMLRKSQERERSP